MGKGLGASMPPFCRTFVTVIIATVIAPAAPLLKCADAVEIDTTGIPVEASWRRFCSCIKSTKWRYPVPQATKSCGLFNPLPFLQRVC